MILESDLRDIHLNGPVGFHQLCIYRMGYPFLSQYEFNLSALLNGRSSLKNGLVILKMNI